MIARPSNFRKVAAFPGKAGRTGEGGGGSRVAQRRSEETMVKLLAGLFVLFALTACASDRTTVQVGGNISYETQISR